MSEHKKEAKAASAAKMQRMGLKLEDGSKSFTDERGGSPFEGLNSGNAGKMPITPSRFKRGGKVGKHADMEGHKAHKNLGKAPRKAAGGSSNMPVPVPPRKDDPDYNPYPYKLTKAQMAALHESEYPNDPSDLGSKTTGYARGGLSNINPAKRKAAIGAMVARKKMAGIPSVAPVSRGVMPAAPMSGLVPMRKSGGAAKHTDEAEDKKLMHKILKPKAFKAEGGRTMHHKDCLCKMCSGGMAERAHRATGGRTKGKTNVNIIISPQSGGQGQGVLGAGVGMGQPPVPPMMPPVPPQMPPQMPPAGGMPMGGAPQLPPQLMAALAARGGAGAPPMPRKTGGRVGQAMPKYQEKDYGSGSGLGRLEKKKWPVADGTE